MKVIPRSFLLSLACLAVLPALHSSCRGQDTAIAQESPEANQQPPQTNSQPPAPNTSPGSQPATSSSESLVSTIDAGEMDDDIDHAPRVMARWNEYRGPYFTVKAGMGFLVDTAAYAQNAASKEQITMLPAQRLRDFRLVFGGSFPSLSRKVTYNVGVMYDAPSHSWFVRQTGVMIAVPKLWGNIFVGRSKEGFSLNKVMVGYDGWTMERSTMSDATIPILADGFKWLGYDPKHNFLWNFGYYNDWLSQGQSFSSYHNQTDLRLVWLPIHSDETRTVLHLGVNLRNGSPAHGQIQFRSRPEAFPAPYFVDTGKFASTNTKMAGYETYYRRGPLLLGSEYWWVWVTSPSTHSPTVHGGDFVATWCITGEARAYNTVQGAFREVIPKKSVFSGGHGAVEIVARFSNIDLNSGTLQGGTFWRFTPMVNWFLADYLRLVGTYGIGRLDRFDLKGDTQFFQTRLQFEF
jgi:phosphate-selective porin OprO/OprP